MTDLLFCSFCFPWRLCILFRYFFFMDSGSFNSHSTCFHWKSCNKKYQKKGLCKSLQVNHYMCLITNCNWQTYIKSWTIQSFAFIRKRQLLICPHTSLTHISNDKQWHRQFAECRTTYNLNHNTKHPLYLAITDRWI